MENITNETVENSNDNKELETTIKNIFKEVASENLKANVEAPKIAVISDYDGLKNSFKEFLGGVLKNNVTVPVPVQYSPLISPMTGNYGQLQNCFRAGDLVSDVLAISRSVSGGTGNWVAKTQRSTNSLSGAVSAYTLNVTMSLLDTWVTLYDYQLFQAGYDISAYVNKEVNRIMPLTEDIQIFTGSGSPFTGLYNDSYVQTVQVGGTSANNLAHLSLTSTRAMVGKIDPQYRTTDLKWYVDVTEEANILALTDANNTYDQIVNGYAKHLGFDVVPMSSGVLNTTSSPSGKHFVLANLKEAVHYADRGLQVEAFRTVGNAFDYRFSKPLAIGVAQPKAYCVLVQPAA